MRDELKKKIDKIIEGHLIHGVIALGCADRILALIDAQRCVWTLDGLFFTTSCGKKILKTTDIAEYETDNMPEYCYGCGHRIEVKEGEDGQG